MPPVSKASVGDLEHLLDLVANLRVGAHLRLGERGLVGEGERVGVGAREEIRWDLVELVPVGEEPRPHVDTGALGPGGGQLRKLEEGVLHLQEAGRTRGALGHAPAAQHGDARLVERNPVPVEALWDHQAASAATLRNLLNGAGYDSVDAILEQGRADGEARGVATSVLASCEARGWAVSEAQRDHVLGCKDLEQLRGWLMRTFRASSADEALSSET